MKISEYIIFSVVGVASVIYDLLSKKIEEILPREAAKKLILSQIFSLAIVPGALAYFKLSFEIGIALCGLINLFIEVIMRKLKDKVENKIEEL